VYQIHSLEDALVILEWAFIFLPILFHGILGVVIVYTGVPNLRSYPTSANYRYILQRATGLIAFAFIFFHVFHLHGWFHSDWWIENVARPLNGANFRAYNAASTLGAAMSGVVIQDLCGRDFGVRLPLGERDLEHGDHVGGMDIAGGTAPIALVGCGVFGVLLAAVGMAALYGASSVDVNEARIVEDRMYDVRVKSGDVKENKKKRAADRPVGDVTGRPTDESKVVSLSE
jgi:succinate dehydrogenase / fumarate reductase, cytochrome b subunit